MEIPRVFRQSTNMGRAPIPHMSEKGFDLPATRDLGRAIEGIVAMHQRESEARRVLEAEEILGNSKEEMATYEAELQKNPDSETHVRNVKEKLADIEARQMEGVTDKIVATQLRKGYQVFRTQTMIQATGNALKMYGAEKDTFNTKKAEDERTAMATAIANGDTATAKRLEQDLNDRTERMTQTQIWSPERGASMRAKTKDVWSDGAATMVYDAPALFLHGTPGRPGSEGWKQFTDKIPELKLSVLREKATTELRRLAEADYTQRTRERAEMVYNSKVTSASTKVALITEMDQSARGEGGRTIPEIQRAIEQVAAVGGLTEEDYQTARQAAITHRKEPLGDKAAQGRWEFAITSGRFNEAQMVADKDLSSGQKADLMTLQDNFKKGMDVGSLPEYTRGLSSVRRLLGQTEGPVVKILNKAGEMDVRADAAVGEAMVEFGRQFRQRYPTQRAFYKDPLGPTVADNLAADVAARTRLQYPGLRFPNLEAEAAKTRGGAGGATAPATAAPKPSNAVAPRGPDVVPGMLDRYNAPSSGGMGRTKPAPKG